ncbi:MAG: polysaccharide pyruvyl transferase family protein [Syntrophaceae bacterium]|nr:polysaccharide pyruvyl transferase family protein [Syntrophaceae bacterium]
MYKQYIRNIKEKIKKLIIILNKLLKIKKIAFLLIRAIKYIADYIFRRDVIYHFGVFGRYANVGDNILYSKMEQITNLIVGKNLKWYHRHIHNGEISKWEVFLINRIAKSIVIGGHGLLMIDTNANENSGWQFNISIENLKKIKIPIIIAAIGYNTFRNQNDFIPIFKDHISCMVEKSVFFGLRNYGSIEALKKYIPEKLHSKLRFQPCPTTMANQFFPLTRSQPHKNNKRIGICVAFDRLENRFGQQHNVIFSQLIKYANLLMDTGYSVQFFAHNQYDIFSNYSNIFEEKGFNIIPLYKLNENEVYQFYNDFTLILGMRGHSLMIPFGAGIPIISLTTQNKQKWFIETLNHSEWSIEVQSDFYKPLCILTQDILFNLEKIEIEIDNIQKHFASQTYENINYIIKELKKS